MGAMNMPRTASLARGITYNGIEVCQDVEGMDKNEMIQNGVSTACAGAANGRTESMECGMMQPTKVTCKEL